MLLADPVYSLQSHLLSIFPNPLRETLLAAPLTPCCVSINKPWSWLYNLDWKPFGTRLSLDIGVAGFCLRFSIDVSFFLDICHHLSN